MTAKLADIAAEKVARGMSRFMYGDEVSWESWAKVAQAAIAAYESHLREQGLVVAPDPRLGAGSGPRPEGGWPGGGKDPGPITRSPRSP